MKINFKCFFKGHLWKVVWKTESKDLCKCERCGAREHFKRASIKWSTRHGKLVKL